MKNFDLEELRNLAPLYVQGSLPESQKKEFEKGVELYPELQDELEAYSSIATLYQNVERQVARPSPEAFNTILEKIDSEERSEKKHGTPVEAALSPSFIETATEWLRGIFAAPQVGWGVAAVQCALIVFLLLPGQQQANYETLSSSDSQTAYKVTLQLVFDDQTTQKEIREVIEALGGQITAGPSSEGMYQVGIDKSEDIDSIVLTLRSRPNVLFLERKL